MASLKLQKINQNDYNTLKANSEIDLFTIYFIADKGTIYVRDKKFGGNVIVLTSETDPEYPELNTIYIYPSLQAKVYNGTSFDLINKGYTINITDESDDSFVPTAKAVASYVLTKINELSESGIGVTDVSVKSAAETGVSISVTKNAVQTDKSLTGVAHHPTYDSTTSTLTIPVTGSETLSINLAKDTVVTAGTYNTDTKEIWLTTSPDKTFDDESKIIKIPASALVNIYTGKTTSSAIVSVSDTNEISVNVNVSAKDGNSLSVEEDGLYVNVPSDENKIDKVDSGHINEVVIANADGSVKASGVLIGSETLSSTPNTNTVATEVAVKAYADSVALNAKSEAITEAKTLAATAETNAKTYADSLIDWTNW